MGNCLGGEAAVKGADGVASPLVDEGPAFPAVDKTISLSNSLLGKDKPEDVTEFYEIGEILGAGQFGTTRSCVHKGTGKTYACKSILKSRLKGLESVANVKQELQIMHHVAGHPNVVSLREAFEDHAYVHLIMELCTGGDLVDRIMAKGRYTEKDAAELVRKMLKVVAYCHEMGVVHRDLKPDNFLLADPSDKAELKVTDFGLSAFFKPGECMEDVCGTAFYVAPEILFSKYNEKADVWAVGVILYILLCGRPPFEADSDEDIFKMIVEDGKPDFSHHVWHRITEPAKESVRAMMTYDPKQRPTAVEMLQHDWVREGGVAGDNVIETEVLHRMKSFAAMNKLKKQALLLIAQRLTADEIRGLKEMFVAMDTDGSGTITVDELRKGLASRGAAMPEKDLQKLMDLADINGNKCMDYEEFVSATMHMCKLNQEEHLLAAFKHFDKDNSGYITKDELEEALQLQSENKLQLDVDVASVLKECDKDQDGRIDYAEFCRMMMPEDNGHVHCNAAKFAAQLSKRQESHTHANGDQHVHDQALA